MSVLQLPLLGDDPEAPFPPVQSALRDPDGLLAIGGDLSLPRLLAAYRAGVFPWYSAGQPILWWTPDPRTVLVPERLHLSRRLRRVLRASDWTLATDTAFDAVVRACALTPRAGQRGTWITPAMQRAYAALNAAGHAHSVEVRDADDALVGGIYGVRIGRMFFGESMFSAVPGASKAALAALCRAMQARRMPLLDCQVASAHLEGLGAEPMPRQAFTERVAALVAAGGEDPPWGATFPVSAAHELA